MKADGYGHGVLTVARAAVDAGAQWLGTTDLGEACALRAAGFTVPILSWLNPFGIDAGRAVADGIDIAVGSVSELEEILVQGVSGVRLHLYADTGMAREACPAAEWPALVELARRAEQEGKVRVVGVMG